MNRYQQFLTAAIFGIFPMFSFAGNQLLEYSIQEALNTDEAKLRLGDTVKFYFAEKPANVTGRVVAVSKVRRKAMRDKVDPCHWAFLSSMLKLKEEALKRNSRIVVNVGSNYKNNLILSKERYQCAVGAVAVEVALQGEFMESSATVTTDYHGAPQVQGASQSYDNSQPYSYSQGSTGIISAPVDTSNAVLTYEPSNPGDTSQAPVSGTAPSAVPAPNPASSGSAVEERLRVLKSLYDVGEIDQKTYEAQKQRIINGI